MPIAFDPTINAGHIIQAVVVLLGGIGIVYTMRTDIKTVKSDMESVKTKLEKITEVLITVGRQDERLDSIDKRLDRVEDQTLHSPRH